MSKKYKLSIAGVEREVKAQGVAIENGMVVFFSDENCTESRFLVNNGKWDSLEVLSKDDAFRVRKNEPEVTVVEPEVVEA